MKISARNAIKGRVVGLKTGAVAAQVVLDIGNADRLTALVAADSVRDMDIKIGDMVTAVIKSTAVMIAK